MLQRHPESFPEDVLDEWLPSVDFPPFLTREAAYFLFDCLAHLGPSKKGLI